MGIGEINAALRKMVRNAVMGKSMDFFCAFAVAILFLGATPAVAQAQITDDQIAMIILQVSRDACYRTGRPCACPDDLARNGSFLAV
jgi:hypothetical protein